MKDKPKVKRQPSLVTFEAKRSSAHAALRKKMHPQVKRMHEYSRER